MRQISEIRQVLDELCLEFDYAVCVIEQRLDEIEEELEAGRGLAPHGMD